MSVKKGDIILVPFPSKFYRYQFNQAKSESQLLAWGQFVALVKGLLSTAALEHLRQAYQKRTILVASLLTTESGLTQENKTITDQRAIARYDYDKDSCPS